MFKKGGFVFLLLVGILFFSLAAIVNAAALHSSPEVNATFGSQNPDPVEPGQIVTVKFKIENPGAETTEDVIVKLIPNFPFTLYGDVAEKNIGKLKAASTGADAIVVEYRLKVDEAAVEGEAELELQVLMGGGGVTYTHDEFLIDIQTHDAVLDITSITFEPKQIAPGETAKITIMIKNMADSLLKDIQLKLNFASSTLPLAPYQSSSERRISQLQSKYQNAVSFNIIADPDAIPGMYKIPLNITYNDEKGNPYRIEDVLAILVGETPNVRVYIKKSSVMQKNKEGKLTLEIANAGTSDIKFLELFLLPAEDYQLVSTSNYFYLGDVDSDDTESEEIDLFIKRGVKTLHLPVKLKYYDANNKPFQQQFDLELPLYSSWTLKKFGLLESSNAGWYFLLLILAVAGFFGYQYYKKYPEKLLLLQKKIPFIKFKKK